MAKIFLWLAQSGSLASGFLTVDQAQELAAITDGFLSFILSLAVLVFSVTIPLLLRTFYLKLQTDRYSADWKLLEIISNTAVYSAEQIYHNGDSVAKYEYAASILTRMAKLYQIPAPSSELCRLLIESSVYNLRRDQSFELLPSKNL